MYNQKLLYSLHFSKTLPNSILEIPMLGFEKEGKKGRREEGKKGRREEGKKGRREEGKDTEHSFFFFNGGNRFKIL
jgi:hypothetical protein